MTEALAAALVALVLAAVELLRLRIDSQRRMQGRKRTRRADRQVDDHPDIARSAKPADEA